MSVRDRRRRRGREIRVEARGVLHTSHLMLAIRPPTFNVSEMILNLVPLSSQKVKVSEIEYGKERGQTKTHSGAGAWYRIDMLWLSPPKPGQKSEVESAINGREEQLQRNICISPRLSLTWERLTCR
jgi:hypothetical protein